MSINYVEFMTLFVTVLVRCNYRVHTLNMRSVTEMKNIMIIVMT